jgi:hypothetical protein
MSQKFWILRLGTSFVALREEVCPAANAAVC